MNRNTLLALLAATGFAIAPLSAKTEPQHPAKEAAATGDAVKDARKALEAAQKDLQKSKPSEKKAKQEAVTAAQKALAEAQKAKHDAAKTETAK